MDARNENLFKNKLDARNSKHGSEIEVGYKGRTFYFERGNYVQSGTRQHNA
jgi:hypothetical protein